MRLAWVIFRKDMRRLWWEASVTTAALCYLVHLDAQRRDFIPGPMEGLLSLVVPAAWAYIIGLAVFEEPLVGDRAFWRTRPFPCRSLLLAKALFALVCVHIPYFIACVFIVTAHGFSPFESLRMLAMKQAAVAAAVTVPALAIAAICRTITQFIATAAVIGVSAFLLSSASMGPNGRWAAYNDDPVKLALACAAVSACGVIAIQFFRSRVALSRTVAFAGALSAAALILKLPVMREQHAILRLPEGHNVELRVEPNDPLPLAVGPPGRSVGVPVSLHGLPEGFVVLASGTRLEVRFPGGKSIETLAVPRDAAPSRDDVVHVLGIGTNGHGLISLRSERANVLKKEPVDLTGHAVFDFYRIEKRLGLPADRAASGRAAGLGRCATEFVDAVPLRANAMLKVYCGSPEQLHRFTRVTLTSGERQWRHALGDSMPTVPYFWNTWLSPMYRKQTFFQMTVAGPQVAGLEWLVPADALPNSRIDISTDKLMYSESIDYHFHDVRFR
jgi:hypothetical protein